MSPVTRTATKLGRFHTADPADSFARLHFHNPLKTRLQRVDHEPKIAVLDQENLFKQGIRVSQFIGGATDVDALGSCLCDTFIEAMSNLLSEQQFSNLLSLLGAQPAPTLPYTDTVAGQRAAIGTYHQVSDTTGVAASEWPPIDCGTSGPYLYQWAAASRLIGTEQIAHGADNIVSLMQTSGLIVGLPWMNAWFEPDSSGFVDGNGSITAFQKSVRSGVAGGHGIYLSAIEKLALDFMGRVLPNQTVLRFRNHWDKSWGDHGSFHMHLSTLTYLGAQVDARAFLTATA